MRTTLEIPEKLIKEAMQLTGAKTNYLLFHHLISIHPFPVEHDFFDGIHGFDIHSRIAFYQDQIGQLAGFNTSQAVLGTEIMGVMKGTAGNNLEGAHTGFHK
ncbi:type II toxin-antitoxin system VapB family antitoxin [Cyclobacterium sp. GBPx2]|uniref:Type II toxin-antitoxin system VapB family antitoxin n=1 Tax=Cyclobacterium plantarum TaxID=2716263 RepID=A0ABX0HEH7_9BACT|nr:type II toxin-antitoxin system VapB family antitoxin [Cyclobacterium plantarum]